MLRPSPRSNPADSPTAGSGPVRSHTARVALAKTGKFSQRELKALVRPFANSKPLLRTRALKGLGWVFWPTLVNSGR